MSHDNHRKKAKGLSEVRSLSQFTSDSGRFGSCGQCTKSILRYGSIITAIGIIAVIAIVVVAIIVDYSHAFRLVLGDG